MKSFGKSIWQLPFNFSIFQDQHAVELKSYQVRLEEAQEKSKTYDEVNSVLRSQLNQVQGKIFGQRWK